MINCPLCGRELVVLTSVYETPYFGKLLLTSITCKCGFRHADSFSAEIGEPVRFTLEINSETLYAKVVRSTSGTIRIPELGLEMEPGPACQGFITNVEGVLFRFESVVEMARRWNSDNPEVVKRCDYIIEKLRLAREGKEKLTLIVEDPYGNSLIIDDKAFMERISREEASNLKSGLTVLEIAGEDYISKALRSNSDLGEHDI